VIPFPELKAFQDWAENDSDKILFTVPDGEVYELLRVYCMYIADAKSQNDRQLVLQIRDTAGVVVLSAIMGDVVSQGETWYVTWAPGLPLIEDETGLKKALIPLPNPTLIPTGFSVRVFDINAVLPAADDMYLDAVVSRDQPGPDPTL
jgi:hypothetical protein